MPEYKLRIKNEELRVKDNFSPLCFEKFLIQVSISLKQSSDGIKFRFSVDLAKENHP
ncbi:hypothetical protein [Clostridium magnum]|uniref:hypothetical protein n=1 Tax=Clostridium magnum TaxID=33954 RepID=UPI000AD0B00C|nr:hypothetical protein [Clostridium magnum]